MVNRHSSTMSRLHRSTGELEQWSPLNCSIQCSVRACACTALGTPEPRLRAPLTLCRGFVVLSCVLVASPTSLNRSSLGLSVLSVATFNLVSVASFLQSCPPSLELGDLFFSASSRAVLKRRASSDHEISLFGFMARMLFHALAALRLDHLVTSSRCGLHVMDTGSHRGSQGCHAANRSESCFVSTWTSEPATSTLGNAALVCVGPVLGGRGDRRNQDTVAQGVPRGLRGHSTRNLFVSTKSCRLRSAVTDGLFNALLVCVSFRGVCSTRSLMVGLPLCALNGERHFRLFFVVGLLMSVLQPPHSMGKCLHAHRSQCELCLTLWSRAAHAGSLLRFVVAS